MFRKFEPSVLDNLLHMKSYSGLYKISEPTVCPYYDQVYVTISYIVRYKQVF